MFYLGRRRAWRQPQLLGCVAPGAGSGQHAFIIAQFAGLKFLHHFQLLLILGWFIEFLVYAGQLIVSLRRGLAPGVPLLPVPSLLLDNGLIGRMLFLNRVWRGRSSDRDQGLTCSSGIDCWGF